MLVPRIGEIINGTRYRHKSPEDTFTKVRRGSHCESSDSNGARLLKASEGCDHCTTRPFCNILRKCNHAVDDLSPPPYYLTQGKHYLIVFITAECTHGWAGRVLKAKKLSRYNICSLEWNRHTKSRTLEKFYDIFF